MRKFIMSDIHGFGNVYYSMMNYIDNISKEEKIELYINGDLFDRGYESAEILLDIKKRIQENKYKIVYLGGNHELMMYEVFEKRKKNIDVSYFNDWYNNGGYITDDGLEEILNDKNKILEVADFVSNLKIYHQFEEKINGKPIVLVHAACPNVVKDNCNIRIRNNDEKVFYSVWTREFEPYDLIFWRVPRPIRQRIGNKKYFTIIGHTPVNTKYGYEYSLEQNYLNIDGGCACYVIGEFKYNHFPLVEVSDNYLKILTFNSMNEIEYGNYFNGEKSILFNPLELSKARSYLNKDLVMNELIRNEDDVVVYKKKLQK